MRDPGEHPRDESIFDDKQRDKGAKVKWHLSIFINYATIRSYQYLI